MQGKEAIIEKIISDATVRGEAVIDDAKFKATEIENVAKAVCASMADNAEKERAAAVNDVLTRSKTVAELDAKKLLFDAKNQVVALTFETALNKVKNLPKEKYAKLVMGMLSMAEDGDVVTISKREKDVLTESVIKEFAAKKKIKLTLNKEFGEFDGGIILSGSGVDKNLTFETEFQLLKDELEETVAKKLFAEA
ncbi:MAG: V-type ATP synthase subunit E family protein [Eubacteriales bacterium]|nr:V-type ATP synthase subunit E family protein [Eubacteriales bacterium]